MMEPGLLFQEASHEAVEKQASAAVSCHNHDLSCIRHVRRHRPNRHATAAGRDEGGQGRANT
ncbi:hypothetical protein D3C81_2143290 [compost metagenome]